MNDKLLLKKTASRYLAKMQAVWHSFYYFSHTITYLLPQSLKYGAIITNLNFSTIILVQTIVPTERKHTHINGECHMFAHVCGILLAKHHLT